MQTLALLLAAAGACGWAAAPAVARTPAAPLASTASSSTAVPAALQPALRNALKRDAGTASTVDPLVWVEQKVTAASGAANDEFGYSVSISGNTALVGAYKGNGGTGAAYVFSQSGGVWSETAKLVASDAASGDQFGWSVSLSAGSALVGARGVNGNEGAAYVFNGAGANWIQVARLVATDGAADARFGNAVALSGGSALVAAATASVNGNSYQGAGYVFRESGGTWTQVGKLVAQNGAGNDQLGVSAAFDGTTAVLGAPGPNMFSGAAYVFTETAGSWSQSAMLTASDGGPFSSFGSALAVEGNTLLVGANLAAMTGAAYVFTGSGSSWTEQQKLLANDGDMGADFGVSVAIDGDVAVIGAERDSGEQGAAYVFERVGGSWGQSQKLVAGDRVAQSQFGSTVAVSGSTVLVGASGLTVAGNLKQGAAYFYASGNGSSDPVVTLTPSALALAVQAGATATTPLKIGNAAPLGGADLTWSIAESAHAQPASFLRSRAARATAQTAATPATLSQGRVGSRTGAGFGEPIVLDASMISQMTDNTPVSPNGISCGEEGASTSDNSWLRRFYFNEHGISDSVTINSVKIAVESGPTIPVTVNLYTIPHGVAVDTIPAAQLTPVGSGSGSIGGTLATTTIAITSGGTITDTVGNDLVVEYRIEGAPAPFFPGGNSTAQTHKSFIVAPECGIDDPVGTDEIGFPEFHIIMVVELETGAVEPGDCQNPSDVPWLSASPSSGTLSATASANVAVTANASGLAAGDYSANLCVTTNDPAQPLVAVPVSLSVSAAPVSDGIFCSGFESGESGSCGPPPSTDIVTGTIDQLVNADDDGSTLDLVSGLWDVYNPSRVDDVNFYDYGDGTLTLYTYGDLITLPIGVVVDAGGAQFAVLQSGTTIGPASMLTRNSNYMINWLDGVDGYLGIAFQNEETGALNYGYIHLTTTGPLGFPARVLEYAYDKSGAAITIP